MPEGIVGLFWTAVFAYAVVGFAFAIPFVISWSGWLDPAARTGSLGFRLTILPGVVVLWPFIAVKTLHARRHVPAPPDPDHPVTQAMQRLIHGAAIGFIAVLLPIVCALALFGRPTMQHVTAGQLQPTPLSNVIPLARPMSENWPIRGSVRTDGVRDQIELEVSRSIDEPIVALFWSPKAAPDGVPQDAVFLGSVWGPARLLFDLPLESHALPGVLTFIALAGEQRVLATLPLDAR